MYNKIIIITPREFSEKEYIKNSLKDITQKKIKLEIWIVKNYLLNNFQKPTNFFKPTSAVFKKWSISSYECLNDRYERIKHTVTSRPTS